MMKILRVLGIAIVCMVMALPVNSVGYQTSLFLFPAASISWGMEKAEMIERLGIDERKSSGADGTLILTSEQLGWDPAEHLGLKLGQSRANLGSILISFTDEDNVYGPEGLDILREMTFSVSAPDIQTVIHRFSRLYGAPIVADIREDGAWVVWFCYPEKLSEPDRRYPWGFWGGSDSILYPHIYLDCKNDARGGVFCEVTYWTGTGSYPEGTQIVWCGGQR